MKINFFIFYIPYIIVHTYSHISPVSESFKTCLIESEMNRDDFIAALQSSNNTKAQCIAACTMEKENFMNNVTINIDTIISKMEDVSQEIGKLQITNLVKSCTSKAKFQFEDKCSIAHAIVKCIHDELRKEGWI